MGNNQIATAVEVSSAVMSNKTKQIKKKTTTVRLPSQKDLIVKVQLCGSKKEPSQQLLSTAKQTRNESKVIQSST